jgi:hypothetical protein
MEANKSEEDSRREERVNYQLRARRSSLAFGRGSRYLDTACRTFAQFAEIPMEWSAFGRRKLGLSAKRS